LRALVGEGRVGAPRVPDTHRPHAFALDPFEHRLATPSEVRTGDLRMALHVFRPAREAEVRLDRGEPAHVSALGVVGRVRASCGPFRVAGEWWGERFDHDGYDVELADGGLYLLGYDRARDTWRIEGVYE
jgi:protein ImuB